MRVERRWLGWGATLAAGLVVLGGCTLAPGTLDAPFALRMYVWSTPTTVEVDAPGWLADTSAVYVCPELPPVLPDAPADRVGWTPGGGCHDYGTFPSANGLTVSLPIRDLSGPERAAFDDAADWYLLILDLQGDRVTTAVRSRFGAPEEVAP